MALENHNFINFIGSVVCKWPVINVTLLTLKIATQNTRAMGYFPIALLKLFWLFMFELDISTNWRPLWYVFCSLELLMLHFFTKVHIITL